MAVPFFIFCALGILSAPMKVLIGAINNLPSLFVAILLFHAKKAGFEPNALFYEFRNVGHRHKILVSFSVMSAFLAKLLFIDKNEENGIPDIQPFLLQTAISLIAIGLFDRLRLTRSQAGDWSQVVRRSPNSVARGLARAFHAYLANVIAGVEGVSWPHVEALSHFLAKELLENNESTWICDKVIVLCPDSVGVRDNVADMVAREKDKKDESHGLWSVVNEKVEHVYEVVGQTRVSVLHLIKLKYGGVDGRRNNYFVFAENRPLVALHQMVTAGLMSQGELQGQFKLLQSELERLLTEDEDCQDKYTVVKYRDSMSVTKVLSEIKWQKEMTIV